MLQPFDLGCKKSMKNAKYIVQYGFAKKKKKKFDFRYGSGKVLP